MSPSDLAVHSIIRTHSKGWDLARRGHLQTTELHANRKQGAVFIINNKYSGLPREGARFCVMCGWLRKLKVLSSVSVWSSVDTAPRQTSMPLPTPVGTPIDTRIRAFLAESGK